MNRPALSSKAFALALLLLAPRIAFGAEPSPSPHKLTEAERQAAVLAAKYLDQGPAAWWSRLSRSSPLRRLGQQAALAEIEVRAGAPAGAEWELEAAPEEISSQGAVFALNFPSGVDDTLVLHLVQEDGAWKIDSLRIAAEPVADPAVVEAVAGEGEGTEKGAAFKATPAAATSPTPAGGRMLSKLTGIPGWLRVVTGAAGVLLLLAAWSERQRLPLAIVLGLAGGAVAATALAAVILPHLLGSLAGGPAGAGPPGMAELRSLLPLRRTLTQAEGAVPAAAPSETRAAGVAGKVAQL